VGTRTEHAPGLFSWVDLTTGDAAAATEFYGGLFGWEFEDNEIPGNGGVYTMATVGGEYVAAISPSTDAIPPHWNSYVTVTSADKTAARAKELAADVIQEPFDVMDTGRMAVVRDPTGASLCVWEPRTSIGAGRVNEPGCLTWNELHTPDPDAALRFLTGLFGWRTERMPTGEGGPVYVVVGNGDRSNGGVMEAQPGEPAHWLPYFVVESRDGAVATAAGLGAKNLFQMDRGDRRTAILADPQGAPFAVYEGPVDD
jgi:predicted enzyme related to lactoylglutathione lyase